MSIYGGQLDELRVHTLKPCEMSEEATRGLAKAPNPM